MSAISGINTGNTTSLFDSGTKETAMGKDDFLKLLVAQMQNQDPMNPSDPTEFTAQLAQFSQLEQLTNMTSSLEGLTSMSNEMERMSALSLIGSEVVAQTDKFHFSGETMELGYDLEMPADDVKLYVLSSTGATLATLSPSDNSPGQHFMQWSGASDAGMPLVPGDYSLVVRAVDGDEKTVPAESLIKGIVSGVDLDPAGSLLETSSGPVKMSKVQKAGASL